MTTHLNRMERAQVARMAAKRDQCPRCGRLAGLARRLDRRTKQVVIVQCRWCDYIVSQEQGRE